jgi:hypothetical protein
VRITFVCAVASAQYAQQQQVMQSTYGQQAVQQQAGTAAYASVPAANYAVQLPPPTYGQQQVTPAAVLPTALTQQTAYGQPVSAGMYGQQSTFDANAASSNLQLALAAAAAGLAGAPPPSLVPQGIAPMQAALAALPASSQQNLAAAVAAAAARGKFKLILCKQILCFWRCDSVMITYWCICVGQVLEASVVYSHCSDLQLQPLGKYLQ